MLVMLVEGAERGLGCGMMDDGVERWSDKGYDERREVVYACFELVLSGEREVDFILM